VALLPLPERYQHTAAALPACLAQVETKTRDNVFVTLLISVQYQVQKENV
jgi:hypothetical protein